MASGILPSWEPIVRRRAGLPYTEEQRQWQLLRRGRYLEFKQVAVRGGRHTGWGGGRCSRLASPSLIATHPPPRPPAHAHSLLYDRGVKFGLDGGRVESIMVSAPPLIAWRYNVQPLPGSDEERLVQVLQQPREWA